MKRAISNTNVLDARFDAADFTGAWLASFGRPELRGSWLVYGGSGSGKTTFMLQLGKYLTNFATVAYNSLEQGFSLSLQRAWERVDMAEAGNKITLLEKETLADLQARLKKRRRPDVVIIDSLHYWVNFGMNDYVGLVNDFRNTLFIFCAHEQKGVPRGALAQYILYNSDVKIRIEGWKAFVTSRYENTKKGEGGSEYIIWEQRADDYYFNKI